jgi:hypothetical protein
MNQGRRPDQEEYAYIFYGICFLAIVGVLAGVAVVQLIEWGKQLF